MSPRRTAGRRGPKKAALPQPRTSTTTDKDTSSKLPALESLSISTPTELRDSPAPATNPWTRAAKAAAGIDLAQKTPNSQKRSSKKTNPQNMDHKKATQKPTIKTSWASVAGGLTPTVSKADIEIPTTKQTDELPSPTTWANVAKSGQTKPKGCCKPAVRKEETATTKAESAQASKASTAAEKETHQPSSAGTPPPPFSRAMRTGSSEGEKITRPRPIVPKTSASLRQREATLEQRERELEAREQKVAHQEVVLNTLLRRLNGTLDAAKKVLERSTAEEATAEDEADASVTQEGLVKQCFIDACLPVAHEPGPGVDWSAPESPQQLPQSLTETIQTLEDSRIESNVDLWNEPAGADVRLFARNVHGEQSCLIVHSEVVAPKCGWLRERIGWSSSDGSKSDSDPRTQSSSAVKVKRFDIDVEIVLSNACFFFAYTGGNARTKEVPVPGMPSGQEILDSCTPNPASPLDLSALNSCLRMYDAAVRLEMPALCCWILEQVETLASNVAEAACQQRLGGLRSDMISIRQTLEWALTFVYTRECQDKWRPMRLAFAGLYDALALRVGPYLTLTCSPAISLLVLRLHEDLIENRQNQGSCMPKTGSLVPSLDEMETTLTRDANSWLWYGSALYQETYLEGRGGHGRTPSSERTLVRTSSSSTQRDEDTESEFETVIHL